MNPPQQTDIVIIGGGVAGTSLFYVLKHFTSVQNVVLIEKEKDFGLVNSHFTNNSQTLHVGDIESNYSLKKATEVKKNTSYLIAYLEKIKRSPIYKKGPKMLLAIGDHEIAELEKRFETFKHLFPEMKLLSRDEIGSLEPNLIVGRTQPVRAIATTGYTVDFHRLSQSFVQKTKTDEHFQSFTRTTVSHIQKTETGFTVQTSRGNIEAKAVAVMTGPHSLWFAKELGYGKHLGILPVAGSFYFSTKKNLLSGKVYTMQEPKLPFAAIHGDPEIRDASITRFGPTAKVLPLLERHNNKTFLPFLKTSAWSIRGVASLFKIISDPTLFLYVLKNLLFDIPLLGRYFFLQDAKKIIPSLKYAHIRPARNYGGIRPQVVNTQTMKMEMGEAEIVGENIVFNITPSPGASTCLGNAAQTAKLLCRFVGESFLQKDWNTELEPLSNELK